MPRTPRLLFIASLACGLTLAGLDVAFSNHCPSSPGNPGGDNWCHQTPPPSNSTPQPTAEPTAQPTPAPTAAPARSTPAPTAAPTRTTRRSTPAPRRTTTTTTTTRPSTDATPAPDTSPSPTPLEDLEEFAPEGSPEILIQGPVIDDSEEDDEVTLETETAAASGGATWAFFIVGLIIGFLLRSVLPLITRGSRKRKQQLFG